ELEARKHEQQELAESQRLKQAQLSDVRKQFEAARGRLASLEALQHAALGQEDKQSKAWLDDQGLLQNSRLGEMLDVQPGWEFAVESVLASLLESVAVDDAGRYLDNLGAVNQGHLALIDQQISGRDFPSGSLAACIKGPDAIRIHLSRVHTAADIASAKALLPRLAEHESVITPSGEWLSKGFVRILRSGHAQQGALQRESEIKHLRAEIQQMAETEKQLVTALAEIKDKLLLAEHAREEAQRSLYLAHRSVSELSGQIQGAQSKLQSAQGRIAAIDAELQKSAAALDEAHQQVRESRQRLQQATDAMAALEERRSQLESSSVKAPMACISWS
ncbi:MAG: chromosome segregation protein, partial [Pseudomonadota bacterium]